MRTRKQGARWLTAVSLIGGVLVSGWGGVQAAGFAILEQSPRGMGNAFAGAAAKAETPATVFFNPAGMVRLEGTQFSGGGTLLAPSVEFEDQGSNTTGGDGGDGGETVLVPNLYATQELTRGVVFGLGVNAPFGLATDYDRDWKGRFHAVESRLKTVNVNPAVAVRLGKGLSLGLGLNVQYADAELSNALTSQALGLPPKAPAEGFLKVEGDSVAVGGNLGLLYELSPDTRFGLAYRSQVAHTLEGDAEFTTPRGTQKKGVSAGLTLPETVELGLYHRLANRWALMGSVTWTHWSRFEELKLEFGDGTQSTTPQDWEDSFRYSLGVDYTANRKWTLRGGITYDETPIPNARRRTPRIPGEDRGWIAFGASYAPTRSLGIDLGYAFVFFQDPRINNTTQGRTLKGEFESNVHLVGVQFNWTP